MSHQTARILMTAFFLVAFGVGCSSDSIAVRETAPLEDSAEASRLVVEAQTAGDTETVEESPALSEPVERPDALLAGPTSSAVEPEVEAAVEVANTEADLTGEEVAVSQQPPESTPVTTELVVRQADSAGGNVATIGIPDIGASAWAVVVAGASDPFDPLLEDTVGLLEQAGYSTTITNCDVGAAEAIALQPQTSFTVSVYVANEPDATALSEMFEADGLPVAATEIVVQCP